MPARKSASARTSASARKPAGSRKPAAGNRKTAGTSASIRRSASAGRSAGAGRPASARAAAGGRTSARPHVCTDRVLPRDLMRPQQVFRRRDGSTAAIAPIGKSWMNGSELTVMFMGGTAAQRQVARTQAGWWEQVANLKFVFGNELNADIRIAFDPNDGAWSYIGTDAKSIPLGEPTMNLGFLNGGTAAHEFGHAIGLAHEHQNPAGGIQWNEQVVIAEAAKSPNFWDEATTRHNILRKYSANQINGTDFDPDSIMLYFFPASWTLNGIATKQNNVLSEIDKQFIAGAKMYPRTGGTVVDAVELKVNAAKRTEASIGKFGEEDLFRFVADRDGDYVIDTTGPTDVVMKLFGPNSHTALIAEDDDSGLGLNPRIGLALVAGEYFVQIRHYNRANGAGSYAIKVRRT